MIPYIAPGAALTAVEWTTLFTAADALVTTALGGVSAVLAGLDIQWDRGFFFFDPLSGAADFPANLHPVASHWLQYNARFSDGGAANSKVFCRQYDDSHFASLIAGCTVPATFTYNGATVTNPDPVSGVIVLDVPAWSAFLPLIYPQFTAAQVTALCPGTALVDAYSLLGLATELITGPGAGTAADYVPTNFLDLSLQVWTKSVTTGGATASYAVAMQNPLEVGTPAYTSGSPTTAEHVQVFKPVDIFINSPFTWNSAWNKYPIIRLHNLASTAVAATFGTVSKTLAPCASWCVRKLPTGWQSCGNYFHWMNPGDPRFIQQMETSGGSCSVNHPGVVADVLAAIPATNVGKYFNVAKFWDASPYYNTGTLFPALAANAPIGDYIVPRGTFLLANLGQLSATPGNNQVQLNWTNISQANKISGAGLAVYLATPVTIYRSTDGVTFTQIATIPAGAAGGGIYQATNTYSYVDTTAVNGTQYYYKVVANVPAFGTSSGGDIGGATNDGSPARPATTVVLGVDSTTPAAGLTTVQMTPPLGTLVPPQTLNFAGFENLAALLAASMVQVSTVFQSNTVFSATTHTWATTSNLELYSYFWIGSAPFPNNPNYTITSPNFPNFFDLSCPLMTFMTGGTAPNPANMIGPWQTGTTIATPPSIVLPLIAFACTTMVSNAPTNTTWSWDKTTYDALGNPVDTGAQSSVTVSVGNPGSESAALTAFVVTTPLSTVETWVAANTSAGECISVVAGSFALYSSPFGMALVWRENWPLKAYFNGVDVTDTAGELPGNNLVFTLSVVYASATASLIITRCRFLNETRQFSAIGTGNMYPMEFGIFPPRSPSSRFMQWNYARTDHRYTTQLSNIKPFYATNPISVDTIAVPPVVDETGLSRPGALVQGGDAWTLLSLWLKGGGVLGPNNVVNSNNPGLDWLTLAAGALVGTVTGVNTTTPPTGNSIGWGAGTYTNALMCQVEHYNALASLINSQPPRSYYPPRTQNTAFTLNFAAGNVFIVAGGSGYAVGDTIGLPETAGGNPYTAGLNLHVSGISTDGNGTVTAIAQDSGATAVVASYDALGTPQRPFVTGTNNAGVGLLIDTTVGDGTQLNFVPTFGPAGVPLTSVGIVGMSGAGQTGITTYAGLTGPVWPRTAYWSWNGGASCGGKTGADPVGAYLASLGVTVQISLPDNYGTPIPNQVLTITGVGTGYTASVVADSPVDYYGGFDLQFQIKTGTYKWMDITDARNLYSTLKIPFVLNAVFTPVTFTSVIPTYSEISPIFESAGRGSIDSYVFWGWDTATCTPPPAGPWEVIPPGDIWYDAAAQAAITMAATDVNGNPITCTGVGVGQGYGPDQIPTNTAPPKPGQSTWTNHNTYGFGLCAGWHTNPAGGWLTTPVSNTIQNDPPAPAVPAGMVFNGVSYGNYLDYGLGPNTAWPSANPFGQGPTVGYNLGCVSWTWTAQSFWGYGIPNWGVLQGIQAAPSSHYYTSLVVLAEGVPPQIVVNIPQNFAYQDPAWALNNLVAFTVFFGVGSDGETGTYKNTIPVIATNIEGSAVETTYISGVGGSTQYETVITTGLANARVLAVTVDGTG